MEKTYKELLDETEALMESWIHNKFPEKDRFKPDVQTFQLIAHKMNEVKVLMRNYYELQDMKIRTGREDC